MEIKEIRDSDGTLLAMLVLDLTSLSEDKRLHKESGIPVPYGTRFITKPELPLQVGIIRRKQSEVIPAHTHTLPDMISLVPRPTTEVLLVNEGLLELTIYGVDEVYECLVTNGSIIMLFSGGHKFKCITDVEMLEIKSGPFLGTDTKVLIDPRD